MVFPADVVLSMPTALFQNVAVKLEPVKASYPQLYYESKLYKILMGGRGIPSARYVCVAYVQEHFEGRWWRVYTLARRRTSGWEGGHINMSVEKSKTQDSEEDPRPGLFNSACVPQYVDRPP